MASYFFSWNPKDSDIKIHHIEKAINKLRQGEIYEESWGCTFLYKKMNIGDIFYLYRSGKTNNGIIGYGFIAEKLGKHLHWIEEKKQKGEHHNKVKLIFSDLFLEPVITYEELKSLLGEKPVLQGGARSCEENTSFILQQFFFKKKYALEKENELSKVYIEGDKKERINIYYERNLAARTICIEHHGLKCSVCNFKFTDLYGDLGDGIIDIHHLTALSEIGVEHVVDPIEDLRPVCPNCHRMLHKKTPAYTIEELKEIINNNKK